jgi:hypothetical protein
MDVKKLARFSVPGHRVTDDRSTKDLHRGIGYDHLHCIVDDHSRIAYVELHPRVDADTNNRTLERALRFFAELGFDPPEAVMTDNAFVYVHGRRFQELLAAVEARHIRTPAYTPRWNGKVERFIQTPSPRLLIVTLMGFVGIFGTTVSGASAPRANVGIVWAASAGILGANVDGSNRHLVATDKFYPDYYFSPSWSSRGAALAFTSL